MIPNALPKSLIDNPKLNRWLRFADGKVHVSTGKVELGQGVLTALAQIAAEELDVDLTRIAITSGETPSTPNEGYTAGSASIEVAGSAIRLAGAEARALFIDRAAVDLRVNAERLEIRDGTFFVDSTPSALDYWTLADRVDLDRDATGIGAAKDTVNYRIVGQSIQRLDLPGKIAGAAFIHDIALDGMMHARVVRRPRRNARCVNLDVTPLQRFAGSVELIREGDFVALMSTDESIAVAAAELIAGKLQWDGGEDIPGNANEPEWLKSQPSVERVTGNGSPLPAKVAKTVTAEYWRSYLAHGSIAPSCAIAHFDGDRLTVYTHSQGIFMLRGALAQSLHVDAEKIDVFHRPGAGCYGHNGADDVAFDACFLALQSNGRPVRVMWSRADELSASPVSTAMAMSLEASFDDQSQVSGWTIHVWSGPHGQRPGMSGGTNLLGAEALPDAPPPVVPIDVPDELGGGALRNALALYELPQKVVSHFIPNLPIRTSSLRGLGALGNVFAIESFMDELADVSGEDPVEYRLSLLNDPRARRVIETAARIGNWTTKPDSSGRSKGFAFSRYKNRAAFFAAIAEVTVEEAVTVNRFWCAVDAGLVINPDGVRNQIEGGIVQATSWALHEEVRFAEGRIASKSWDEYPIIRFSEVPEIVVELVSDRSDPALGVGEVALGPTVAAIGNAVARALGTRIRRLPFSRERLMGGLLASD